VGTNVNVRQALCAALAVAVVGGCAGPVVGEPSPTPGTQEAAGRGSGIDVTGLDPCTALTAEQATSLGVGGPKAGTAVTGYKYCLWSGIGKGSSVASYYVDSATDIGFDRVVAAGSEFKIGRYRAVDAKGSLADFDNICQVMIDVHPGQLLQVNYSVREKIPIGHAAACQKAIVAASMVVANLDRGGN
jgi:hypothetical protein